jgi:hypothetical protein
MPKVAIEYLPTLSEPPYPFIRIKCDTMKKGSAEQISRLMKGEGDSSEDTLIAVIYIAEDANLLLGYISSKQVGSLITALPQDVKVDGYIEPGNYLEDADEFDMVFN